MGPPMAWTHMLVKLRLCVLGKLVAPSKLDIKNSLHTDHNCTTKSAFVVDSFHTKHHISLDKNQKSKTKIIPQKNGVYSSAKKEENFTTFTKKMDTNSAKLRTLSSISGPSSPKYTNEK